MVAITREQHEAIFYNCMSLIEKPEYHDGAGIVCAILILNDIHKMLYIIILDDM